MGKIGIYLLANYPSRETFIEAVRICNRENIDFLEIGFPFSDPVADGDALEKACCDTLRHYTTDDAIDVLQDVRKMFQGKLYVMTYANIVHSLGVDMFVEKPGMISGMILADVPAREAKHFENLFKEHRIPIVRFLTPESREEDIDDAVKGSRDFIYFVSKRGTTGGGFSLDEETRVKIRRAREKGGLVFLGFGIKNKRDVQLAFEHADGAIIGTGALEALNLGIRNFSSYIAGLKG